MEQVDTYVPSETGLNLTKRHPFPPSGVSTQICSVPSSIRISVAYVHAFIPVSLWPVFKSKSYLGPGKFLRYTSRILRLDIPVPWTYGNDPSIALLNLRMRHVRSHVRAVGLHDVNLVAQSLWLVGRFILAVFGKVTRREPKQN